MGNVKSAGNIENAGAEFLVTPGELLRSAQMMNEATEKAKKEIGNLTALIGETDVCFQGKAKEHFVKRANILVTEWQELLDGLHNNISGLQEIAGNYENAEGENVNVVMENDS